MPGKELPRLPSKEEIARRAVELYMLDHPEAERPEIEELKEGSYWERAKLDLMMSEATKAQRLIEEATEEERAYLYDLYDKLIAEVEGLKQKLEAQAQPEPRRLDTISKQEALQHYKLMLESVYGLEVDEELLKNFEEEWPLIAGLPPEQARKYIDSLCREKARERLRPPVKPPEVRRPRAPRLPEVKPEELTERRRRLLRRVRELMGEL